MLPLRCKPSAQHNSSRLSIAFFSHLLHCNYLASATKASDYHTQKNTAAGTGISSIEHAISTRRNRGAHCTHLTPTQHTPNTLVTNSVCTTRDPPPSRTIEDTGTTRPYHKVQRTASQPESTNIRPTTRATSTIIKLAKRFFSPATQLLGRPAAIKCFCAPGNTAQETKSTNSRK